MKKGSTAAAKQSRKFSQQKLNIGLDLGDRSSWYCVLDEQGELQWEQKLSTTAKAMREAFSRMPRSRIALETGVHSPWVSRLLSELGHELILAHARNVRLIGESRRKDDRLDAQTLARLARIDPQPAVSGEAPQRQSAGGSDGDPGASGTGTPPNGAGQQRTWTGQELRRAVARLQRAQHESRPSRGAES